MKVKLCLNVANQALLEAKQAGLGGGHHEDRAGELQQVLGHA